NADYAVIEVSSYQAADFDGICDLTVLTSLYPEHADWHRTIERYVRDKLNLLNRSRCRIINSAVADVVNSIIREPEGRAHLVNDRSGIHADDRGIFDGQNQIGVMRNAYLGRVHNRSNLCAALTVSKALDIDLTAALDAAGDFQGLPHRQQELGKRDQILFV